MSPSEKSPLLETKEDFPMASFVGPRQDKTGRRFPQAIAHRGYKAAYPENTMSAFVGAVAARAHAIETDVHLSKDNVVVLSHDATLKRCFGRPEKIIDCDWSYLSTLQTVKYPPQTMPRLKDLLSYLATPGLEDVWLLLDIKLDNNANDVMRLIAQTIEDVDPSSTPWNHRIVLGCWAANYLPLCYRYLPSFPIAYIGFSISYARQFLKVPNISFNLLDKILMTAAGDSFLHDARAAHRPVFVWTVNEEDVMRWSIRKEVDGVITDDPKKFREVCDGYEGGPEPERLPWKTQFMILWINWLALVFGLLFRWRYMVKVDQRWMSSTLETRQ